MNKYTDKNGAQQSALNIVQSKSTIQLGLRFGMSYLERRNDADHSQHAENLEILERRDSSSESEAAGQ